MYNLVFLVKLLQFYCFHKLLVLFNLYYSSVSFKYFSVKRLGLFSIIRSGYRSYSTSSSIGSSTLFLDIVKIY